MSDAGNKVEWLFASPRIVVESKYVLKIMVNKSIDSDTALRQLAFLQFQSLVFL